jgi:hypothetical protein
MQVHVTACGRNATWRIANTLAVLSLGTGTAASCNDAHKLQQLLHATLQKGAASNQTLAVRTLSWKLLIQPSSSCIGGSFARVVASSLSMVSTEASSCSPDSSCSPQKDPGFLQDAHNKGKPMAEYCDCCLQQPPCTPTSALPCKQMFRLTGSRIHGQYKSNHVVHRTSGNHSSTPTRVRVPHCNLHCGCLLDQNHLSPFFSSNKWKLALAPCPSCLAAPVVHQWVPTCRMLVLSSVQVPQG